MNRQKRFAMTGETELCMYQVSTLQALAMGCNKAVITVEELLRHGDTGLGTFEGVDGEMIVADGVCYRATVDGSVVEVPPELGVPFSSVSHLSGGHVFDCKLRAAHARMDKICRVELQLPASPAFDTYTLKDASQDEIRQVEQGGKA